MFSAGNTMTCVDVMYQPYATYFPYHHHHHHHHHQRSTTAVHGSLDAIKFGVSKLQDPLETSPLTFQTSTVSNSLTHGTPPSAGVAPPTGSSTPLSHSISAKEESDPDKEDTPHNTQYLSSNCVLVTYFSGDIAANVDEHFSRALSQPSSYNTESHGGSKANTWKDTSPMSQRNFPPSFWNSSYQPPAAPAGGALSASSHQDLPGFTADPYGHMTSSLHGSLHGDPWRYPLTTQSAYTHHHHHAVPDLSGYTTSGRFNHHYGSLLPGAAAARFGAMSSQCDPLSKHTDTWTARYTHTDLSTTSLPPPPPHPDSMTSLHGVLAGGIDSAVQDSKDLYWF